MPDGHQGLLACPSAAFLAVPQDSVIPYAVGVDIACRMKLSVYDIPADQMKRLNDTLVNALNRETLFGAGAHFRKPLQHDVLDEDWSVTKITQRVFEKAREQLGTSGSGNHFVEFGILTIPEPKAHGQAVGFEMLSPGSYLALLSHSGSRGAGAQIASHYSKLARDLHPELPPELSYLSWLDLNSEPGQEYWAAMNLMGKYAHANHALIHQKVARSIGAKVITGVENHHNFAWKETHDGREMIVTRKALPAAKRRVLGEDSRAQMAIARGSVDARGKGGSRVDSDPPATRGWPRR